MTLFDSIILIWAGLLVWSGYRKGLILTITALAGWMGALFIASHYSSKLSGAFAPITTIPAFQLGLAFIALVLVCLLMSYGVGLMIRSLVRIVHLGFFDRLGGASFGALKALFIFLVVLSVLSPFISQRTFFRDSKVAPALLPYAPFALQYSQTLTESARHQLRQSLRSTN